jgi:hypothetical protein
MKQSYWKQSYVLETDEIERHLQRTTFSSGGKQSAPHLPLLSLSSETHQQAFSRTSARRGTVKRKSPSEDSSVDNGLPPGDVLLCINAGILPCDFWIAQFLGQNQP